jgi:hypothetical protein
MGNEERVRIEESIKSEDIVMEEDAEETLRAKVGSSKEMRMEEKPLCLESRLPTSAEMRGLNNECKNI